MPRQAVSRAARERTIVCEACGCRLTTRDSVDDRRVRHCPTWWHFAGHAAATRGGCTVACVELAHRLAYLRPGVSDSRRHLAHLAQQRDAPVSSTGRSCVLAAGDRTGVSTGSSSPWIAGSGAYDRDHGR